MLKVEEEVIISNNKLKDQSITNLEAENSSKQVLVADTQSKTCGKEKVNSDLEKQYKYLEESTELLDKNRQTQREINLRDYQSNTLQNKLQECEVNSDSSALLECKLLLGVAKTESFNSILEGGVKEVSVWGVDNRGTDYPISKPVLEVKDEKKDDCEIVVSEVGCLKGEKDPVKICTLLAVRLEELAAFLDFLLKNNELVNGTRLIKSDDIKQVLEKSRELSRHLSRSFANRNLSDTSVMWCKLESSCDISLSTALCDSFAQNNCSGDMGTADKVISEQTLIINRLREQLKFLNQEIKQRDIELSRCQGTSGKAFDDDLLDFSDEDGIEKQTMSICQELSDEIGEYENEFPKEWNNEKCEKQENPESLRADKSCKKMQYFVENKNPCKDTHSHETSESEAWSEPDRSVSLARMGGLDDVGLNLSQRNFKCADSTDSSEGTLNENTRISGNLNCNFVFWQKDWRI